MNINDASALPNQACQSVGCAATRENAGVGASLSPDVVERVAKVLAAQFYDDHSTGRKWQVCEDKEDYVRQAYEAFTTIAKAVIAAMKEGV